MGGSSGAPLAMVAGSVSPAPLDATSAGGSSGAPRATVAGSVPPAPQDASQGNSDYLDGSVLGSLNNIDDLVDSGSFDFLRLLQTDCGNLDVDDTVPCTDELVCDLEVDASATSSGDGTSPTVTELGSSDAVTVAGCGDAEAPVECEPDIPQPGVASLGADASHGQQKKRARSQETQILAFKQKHPVRPVPQACDGGRCKFDCASHVNAAQRQTINEAANSLPRDARMQWYATYVRDITPTVTDSPSLTDYASAKRRIIAYHLPLAEGKERRVCKEFYLTTLGYAESNDGPVISAVGRLTPKPDMRGKASPQFALILETELKNHIERYRPVAPHYRYMHAPNRRYLPHDLSAAMMYGHLVEERGRICTYERFRQALRAANVSFTKLGSEECETCKIFNVHVTTCTNHEDCSICQDHTAHLDRAEQARADYAKDRQRVTNDSELFVSADMMRVTLLPILPHKVCVFTPRLITYNETFTALGGKKGVCVLWHEGISGRDAPDVASAFMKFAELNHNTKHLTFWVDNCSAQNKNWTFFSALQHMVNKDNLALQTVTVKYLEKGHTSMSADSIHQVVNKCLSKSCVQDFRDFVHVCESSGPVHIMTPGDFHDVENGVSQAKLKRLAGDDLRPMLRDLKVVQARRGDGRLFVKSVHGHPRWSAYDLFKTTFIPTEQPARRKTPRGVNKEKLARIMQSLTPLMAPHKREFWTSLEGKNVRDLAG